MLSTGIQVAQVCPYCGTDNLPEGDVRGKEVECIHCEKTFLVD